MTVTLSKDAADEKTKAVFARLNRENAWVDTDESAKKMLRVLKEECYISGDQIDFYDDC